MKKIVCSLIWQILLSIQLINLTLRMKWTISKKLSHFNPGGVSVKTYGICTTLGKSQTSSELTVWTDKAK